MQIPHWDVGTHLFVLLLRLHFFKNIYVYRINRRKQYIISLSQAKKPNFFSVLPSICLKVLHALYQNLGLSIIHQSDKYILKLKKCIKIETRLLNVR